MDSAAEARKKLKDAIRGAKAAAVEQTDKAKLREQALEHFRQLKKSFCVQTAEGGFATFSEAKAAYAAANTAFHDLHLIHSKVKDDSPTDEAFMIGPYAEWQRLQRTKAK